MKKSTRNLLLTFVVLLLAGILAALNFYGTFYYDNVADLEKQPVIQIPRSYDYDQMIAAVLQSGAIDNEKTFLRTARFMKLKDQFRPGQYRFRKGMGNKALVRSLQKGWQTPVRLVIPGYFRSLDRFADFLGEQLEASAEDFNQALHDSQKAAQYGFTPETFIGMFIPNTYEVWWTVTPDEFIGHLKKLPEVFYVFDENYKWAYAFTNKTVDGKRFCIKTENKD